MATQAPPAPALRPELAAMFVCRDGKCGPAAPRPVPGIGILAELAAQGRPQ